MEEGTNDPYILLILNPLYSDYSDHLYCIFFCEKESCIDMIMWKRFQVTEDLVRLIRCKYVFRSKKTSNEQLIYIRVRWYNSLATYSGCFTLDDFLVILHVDRGTTCVPWIFGLLPGLVSCKDSPAVLSLLYIISFASVKSHIWPYPSLSSFCTPYRKKSLHEIEDRQKNPPVWSSCREGIGWSSFVTLI